MSIWIRLLLCALVSGCASTAPREALAPLFADALFAAPKVEVSADHIFELSPAMRQHLASEIAPAVRAKGPQQGLIDALYAGGRHLLEYDSALTRSAAQAFDARAGNCLSLVIMTAAFARELRLEVRFQQVTIDETFGRRGDLVLAFGHINLALGRLPSVSAFTSAASTASDWMTIDFLPPRDSRGLRYQAVGDATVRSMFLNNRAAEALVQGEVDDAYWWARAAVLADRGFAPAYNTLAVVYQRRGHLAPAEQVLRRLLARRGDDVNALSNLIGVLKQQGRSDEAGQLALQLQQLQPTPPFAWLDQGLQALREGNPQRARELLQKEVDRDPDYHESNFWLAVAHLQLGNPVRARQHLERARDNSLTRDDQALYTSKLARLKAQTLR
ncbi:MAG: tetratricopeptide repeat protein [Rubrivivax sp.]|nr:tetratricopeptide repeat protein [Rubrivivax sp.]